MGGLELSATLAVSYPQLKTVFMSGYAGDVDAVQKLYETRAVLLQKPFSTTFLANTIRSVLDNVDTPAKDPAR